MSLRKKSGLVRVNNCFLFFFFFFLSVFSTSPPPPPLAFRVRDRGLTVWQLTPFVSYELYSFPPPPSPYFQPPPLSSSFSNLTIGLQKPWDRIPPLLSCHHRLHLTLWRPCHHKQHNLKQKYPTTPRRRKVPQKKGKPHQPQKQRSQVSLFISFLVLLIISGLICL